MCAELLGDKDRSNKKPTKVSSVVKFLPQVAETGTMKELDQGPASSVKSKIKQGFSSFDLLTTMLAVVVVGGISAPILFKTNESHDLAIANAAVIELSEKLTNELISRADGNSVTKTSQRGPASVASTFAKGEERWEGFLDKDPWGQSYAYKVVRDVYGLPTHLIVWSRGPNGIQDTPDSALRISNNEIRFSMDDLGHLRELY